MSCVGWEKYRKRTFARIKTRNTPWRNYLQPIQGFGAYLYGARDLKVGDTGKIYTKMSTFELKRSNLT